MNLPMRVRASLLFALVLLCLPPFQATASQEATTARQEAAAANDNATTLEERRAALEQLQEAARLFLSASEPIEAARALNRVGRLQLLMNEPKKSIQAHNEALRLIKTSSDYTTEVDGLNGLAAAFMRLQKGDEAEAVLRHSISLSRQAGYTAGQAEALLTLSDRQNYLNHALALQTAQQALSLWQTLNDKAAQARTHYQIGDCYLAQNLVYEATENYQAMLRLSRELDDRSQQAAALIALGFAEYRKGDWAGEMSYLSQAQGLVDENADPFKMGQISFGLAEALSESGLPEQALIHFQQALDYLRQTQNPNYVGYALWQIGCTHYLLGNYSEAITQLNLALAADEPDGILAAQCHEFLGRVYLATGEREAALRHLQLALNVYSKTANPKEAAQARAVMGQVFEQQGQFQRAADYYKQALTAFEKLADTVNAATVYYALGGLELKRGDYDAAENYLSRSVSHTENLRRVSTSRDLAAAFSANVHERYISYIDCLMRESQKQPERSLDVRAFETSELARARSLTDLLLATQTNFLPGVDAQLAEQEKSLRQSLRVKEDARISLLAKTYKKEELDALNREIASLETKYKQATDTIRARYPAYDQINRPTGWNLDQIKEQVIADDDTALLEYSLGREKSYLWVVTRAGLTSYELPSAQLINESAERVYGLLSGDVNPETEQSVAQAGRQLSQMVLLPAALHLNKRRLIVVADGALNYIPFQFLPTPDSAPEPLIANHEVVYAPSASILGELHIEASRRRQPTTLLAAFGDPVFAPNYVQHKSASAGDYIATVQPPEGERWRQALRDIEPEGDTVDPESIQPLFYSTLELANLREVAGPDSLVATGFDATPEKLAAADLTKYAILHFATHGILDAKRPENSGLFLSMVDREGKAQNGFVGLRDIYALHAPVDLVVLSACRTGLGKDVRGEGLIGLTRGFMYAGASSVMASLWKVDDEATAELMKQFYSNMLQKEMTPAEALRAAQNTVRQKPQWHSPYYWAAFTLQGEYRHVIKPTGANHNYAKIAAGLLLVLITALAWMYWRRRTTRYSTVK